jgi:hypothetical protein
LDRLERALIDLYKPRYNIKLKSPQPVATEFTLTVGSAVVTMNAPQRVPRFERRI